MSALLEYIAFARIEPWGDHRADLRAGIVASTIYNTGRGRGQRALRPRDFMPNFDAPRVQTPEQIGAILTMFAKAHNANLKAH